MSINIKKIIAAVTIALCTNLFANNLLTFTKNSQSANEFIPKPPSVKATSYVIMDANSGSIIAEKNAHELKAPASLTKMLTLYIISDQLTRGEINLDEQVRISTKAWKTGGSKTFVKEGQYTSIENLIKGVIVQSGNDACIALVEHIAGGTESFVNMMNQRAKILGMRNSNFTDPIGMPSPNQKTTAYDIAILTKALIKDFPQFYHWYQQKWFTFNGIKQPNRNRLLWRLNFVDGVKTGHTDAAGFVQASSGVKNGMRIIVVTLGSPTDEARAQDGKKLFNYAYRFFESHSLYSANKEIGKARIWFGQKSKIPVGVASELFVTIPSGKYEKLTAKLKFKDEISAPIKKGSVLGKLIVKYDENTIQTVPVISLDDSTKANFAYRAIDSVKLLFHRITEKFS